MGKVVVTIEKENPNVFEKCNNLGYEKLSTAFTEAGFSDITIEVEYDIISGCFADVGEVESVPINGKRSSLGIIHTVQIVKK